MRSRTHHFSKRTRGRRGLTLIELVLVLAILVSLASMSVPLFNNLNHEATQNVTIATLRQLQDTIMNRYATDMAGKVPFSAADPLEVQAIAKGLPGPIPGSLLPTGRTLFPQLHFLFVNPSLYAAIPDEGLRPAWKGPYLMADRGTYPGADPAKATANGFTTQDGIPRDPLVATSLGDRTVLDGWGNPIVIRLFAGVVDEPGGLPTNRAYLVSAGPNQQIDVVRDATNQQLIRGDDEVLLLLSW